jgi:hypothetical protein
MHKSAGKIILSQSANHAQVGLKIMHKPAGKIMHKSAGKIMHKSA